MSDQPPDRRKNIVDRVPWHHMVSLGHNEVFVYTDTKLYPKQCNDIFSMLEWHHDQRFTRQIQYKSLQNNSPSLWILDSFQFHNSF